MKKNPSGKHALEIRLSSTMASELNNVFHVYIGIYLIPLREKRFYNGHNVLKAFKALLATHKP